MKRLLAPEGFMSDINNALEIIVNLIFLAKHSANDPQQVIDYLSLAEKQVLTLAVSLRDQVPPEE